MTTSPQKSYLTMNAGSSSIKFALFRGEQLERVLSGKLDRIGVSGTFLSFCTEGEAGPVCEEVPVTAMNHTEALTVLMDALGGHVDFGTVVAIGHRVVHGMNFDAHMPITPLVVAELKRSVSFAPEHLPQEIALIEAFATAYPELTQVACFDTAFHRTMPKVASILPLPQRFEVKGFRRFGFHGLSYEYLLEELGRNEGAHVAQGKVIMAHLGNGASMTACQSGVSVETSMGFTPLSGLPMGTRTGDLDPGALLSILSDEHLSTEELSDLLNHQSGLLGISGLSSNMLDLLQAEGEHHRAHLAVEYFCYQARKYIGAYTAVLGGLETLVFSGGMGENSSDIRSRICSGLAYFGIEIDEEANARHARVISKTESRVTVLVIPTNEEIMIARTAQKFSDILS